MCECCSSGFEWLDSGPVVSVPPEFALGRGEASALPDTYTGTFVLGEVYGGCIRHLSLLKLPVRCCVSTALPLFLIRLHKRTRGEAGLREGIKKIKKSLPWIESQRFYFCIS